MRTQVGWITAGVIAAGLSGVAVAQENAAPNAAADVAQAEDAQAVQQAAQQAAEPVRDLLQADAPVQQLAIDPQAAAVAQLQAEIDAMLTPEGLVAPGEAYGDNKARLVEIANTSNGIANDNTDNPAVEYAARQNELRAYNALAQDATVNRRTVEASYRLTQLRNAASQAQRSKNSFANATGDFWLLVADLTDVNRVTQGVEARQAEAKDKLEAFLESHDDEKTPLPIRAEAAAALVRLHDQAGNNGRACALLNGLKAELPAGDARLKALADVEANCGRLGKPAAFAARTLGGESWSSTDLAGQRVLIHCYADWSEASVAVFAQLEAKRAELEAAGVSLVSISAGPTVRKADDQSWPVVVSKLGADGVITKLGVRGLPWLIALDQQGNISHIARTQRVVDLLLTADQTPAAPVAGEAPINDADTAVEE